MIERFEYFIQEMLLIHSVLPHSVQFCPGFFRKFVLRHVSAVKLVNGDGIALEIAVIIAVDI